MSMMYIKTLNLALKNIFITSPWYICIHVSKKKLKLDLFFKKNGHKFYNPYIEKKTLYEIGQ
jgi:hypothetical protein